jgi:hypothetical protein
VPWQCHGVCPHQLQEVFGLVGVGRVVDRHEGVVLVGQLHEPDELALLQGADGLPHLAQLLPVQAGQQEVVRIVAHGGRQDLVGLLADEDGMDVDVAPHGVRIQNVLVARGSVVGQ